MPERSEDSAPNTADFFTHDDPSRVRDAIARSERESHGEVANAETIYERTGKPERGGLHCARIFGPIKDLVCLCGKYAGEAHRGVVCEKCGVVCEKKSLRDERWGHFSFPIATPHPIDASIEVTRVPVTPPGWRCTHSRAREDQAYQRLINRSLRLRRLIELDAPAIILDNETRMFHEAFGKLHAVMREELLARRAPSRITASPEARALLEAIYQAPGDDGPRRRYAEFLTDAGDPRGEFIHLQLANAHRARMTRAAGVILARHLEAWVAPLGAALDLDRVRFRRGFMSAGCVDRHAVSRDRGALDALIGHEAWSTFESLETQEVALLAHPVMRSLKKITITPRTLRGLADQPRSLDGVEAAMMRLGAGAPTGDWLGALDDAPLPALREAIFLHKHRHHRDWSWLLESSWPARLTQLTISGTAQAPDAATLAPWIERLTHSPGSLEKIVVSFERRAFTFTLTPEAGRVAIHIDLSAAAVERAMLSNEATICHLPEVVEALGSPGRRSLSSRLRGYGEALRGVARRMQALGFEGSDALMADDD